MSEILCPNCGTPNPPEQDRCFFCQHALHPIVDKERVRPGLVPTEKSTSELEPMLPDWLRQAREAARSTTTDQEEKPEKRETPLAEPAASSDLPEWLAGLEAVARDEAQDEELPDWLREQFSPPSALAESPPPTPPAFTFQEFAPEAFAPDELGGVAQISAPEAEEADLMSWLRGPEEEAKPLDEVSDWLSRLDEPSPPSAEPPTTSPFLEEPTPPATGELLDWLNQATAETAAPQPPPSTEETPLPAVSPFAPAAGTSLDDWFAGMTEPEAALTRAEDRGLPAEDTFDLPDWLKSAVETAAPAETAPVSTEPSFPLDHLPSTGPGEGPTLPLQAAPPDSALPDWLSQLQAATAPPPKVEPFQQADLPDWPRSSKPSEAGPPPFGAETEPAGPVETALPEYLASFAREEASTTAPTPPAAPTELPRSPAFLAPQEEARPAASEDIFSLEMPEWLSAITPAEEPKPPFLEDLAPAELPSWVQAMRPVETVLTGAPTSLEEDVPIEVSGPLAGLQGVLPPIDVLISGKPKPQGLLLQASEAQQADALLLEQILNTEAQPKPIRSSLLIASQKTLRWALATLLVLTVLAVQIVGFRAIPLPVGLPIESNRALQVLDALPVNAPLLMIFDYQPALAGELEAVAIPFVDRLLGLRSPNITALSTSPTGMALAERFLTRLEQRYPSLENTFIRLGYLPGGVVGIRTFALYPRLALPSELWNRPALQAVQRFSDYRAMILLTDQAGLARAWIEQTGDQRQGNFLVVIASTQAAPLIQPYLLSGQAHGLLSGLPVGAAFEATSNLSSPVSAYWNAYHIALSLVVLLILLGGIVSLVARVRGRYSPNKAEE